MKKGFMKRLYIAMLSVVICVFCILPYNPLDAHAFQQRYYNFSNDYVLTDDAGENMLNIALAQKGKTGGELGYSEAWCADFVSDCAVLAGQSDAVPGDSWVATLERNIRNAGGQPVSSPSSGDIVFFGGEHVEIVCTRNGSLQCIGGNNSGNKCAGLRSVSDVAAYFGTSVTYIRPAYNGIHADPQSNDDPYAPYPRPTGLVVSGMKGSSVGWVQYTLHEWLGYDIGSAGVDCDFGEDTKAAVMNFQRDHGLEDDGIVGDLTRAAIIAEIDAKRNQPVPTPHGSPMESGLGVDSERIPDGDYYILSRLNQYYYLDIEGAAVPAANQTNVIMTNSNKETRPPECDVWTVHYEGNGFYTISQKDANVCLEVYGADTACGANVSAYTANGSDAQLWSIVPTDTGYLIQAKCSGYCLDIYGSNTADGTNVLVWQSEDTDNQRWAFVPYAPSIGQTVEDGIYTIQSAVDSAYCIDADGSDVNGTNEYKAETNIQLWETKTCNDKYKIEYLGDGYYSIYETVTGLALDVVDKGAKGYLNKNVNIQLFGNNQTLNQKWIIRDTGDGYYNIISAYSGYSVDLDGGVADNNRNIRQHYHNKSDAQKWKFVAPLEKPSKSVLTVDKIAAFVDEKITFTAESDTATSYTIRIDKDGEQLITQNMTNGTLSLSFDEPGEYSAFVTAFNVMGSEDSQKISFSIKPYELRLYETEKHTIVIAGEKLSYKSSNTKVAVVSKTGVITALGYGNAIITVTNADGNQQTILVQVCLGDCTGDKVFNNADLSALLTWLKDGSSKEMVNWERADFDGDEKLTAIDLSLMKRALMK